MKNYNDYKSDKKRLYLTEEEMKKVVWTKYKIIVPTKEDKDELMEAFYHIHNSDVDTDNIVINQLSHEYLEENYNINNIIVDKDLFEKLNKND